MRKYITVLVLAIVAGTGNIYAQYAPDALRFSQTNYGSSSRFKGLGNAQISLGGDISSLGGNPAGLGMFTKSEFSITPEFNNTQSKATYFGQKTNDNKSVMNLNQIGAVWYSPVTKPRGANLDKGLLSVVWGLGYNRNNDFGSRVSFGGANSSSSIANDYAQQANGLSIDDMGDLPYMAYQNRLIDQVPDGSTSYLSAGSLNNQQNYTEIRSGSTSELDFSAGLNFSNKLYLGASIGVVNVRYLSDYEFDEAGTNTSTVPAQNEEAGKDYNLSLRQSQTTDGSGVNGRLGLIYKPINAVRIGATFQTPTWMHVEDNTVIALDTRYHSSESGTTNYTNDPANYNFIYSLRTPYKGSLGASVIIGNHALLSADVDYVDYASMKFSTAPNTDNGFDALDAIKANNDQIKRDYTDAINYRIGGEYKIGALALRAGFAYNGSPYKVDDDNATKYYSGGLGYRFGMYYLDLAYQRAETHNTYNPYALDEGTGPQPIADVNLNKNNVFLTLGVNF